MALNCASSQTLIIQKSGRFHFQYRKQRFHVPLPLMRKAPPPLLRISASINSKVYEDETEGIVCYKDESSGEIICEGYDEGPRLPRIPTTPTYHPRDVEIMSLLLQQSLLQIVKGEETFNPSLQRLCLHQHFNNNFTATEI
ncbi:uncharacterized protein LOC114743702 [Neltuma alba]|uniref:uncharacterized protein LOC114743702 n=1 Tax=Neltuma alba TaxID=207710 RepID=UPI0010A53574|nr:uncharacterized protein LOC114743702 [Prosopis alba]